MILIVTHKEDYTADIVINILNDRNINYKRYNTEDFLSDNNTSISLNSFSNSASVQKYHQFNSVWFRRVKLPNIKESDMDRLIPIYSQLESFFQNMWEVIDAKKWMSVPSMIYRAESKLLQLKEATKVGLKIPNTLVTSNINEIRDFYFLRDEKVIIKPLNGSTFHINKEKVLIYTNQLQRHHIDSLEKYLPIPYIFQEYIDKELEIRATVVSGKVFSACVYSQGNDVSKIDWRRGDNKFEKYNLPNIVEKQLIYLTKNLNLEFGAIDLILNKNGDYIFLELNPNGQWGWIEFDTQLPIAEAIVDFLNS